MTNPFAITYRRCFYTMAAVTFNPARPHQLGLFEAFHILSFVYSTTRLLTMVFLLYTHFPSYTEEYIRYDVWSAWFRLHHDRFDFFIPVLCYLFVLCYHVIEYLTFRIDVHSEVWSFWYELIVVSGDQLEECRLEGRQYEDLIRKKIIGYSGKLNSYRLGQVMIKNRMTMEWVFKKFAEVEAFWKMENIDQGRLMARPLLTMPYLSAANRQKILVNVILYDAYGYVFQVAVAIIFVIFMLLNIYIYPDWHIHPWPILIIATVEAISVGLGFLRMMRMLLFFVGLTIFSIIVYPTHVKEIWQMVEKLIGECTKRRQSVAVCYRVFLHQALREHIKVCHLVQCGNFELFGNVMYIFVLTMVPINIFIVRRLVFLSQSPLETLIFWLICFFQLAIFFGIFASLSWCCTVYHHPKKTIPRLQSLMRGDTWRVTKLKLDDLYGRLIRGPKIAISIGPINAVTYLTSVELLCSYVAYLLMAFSYQIAGQVM